VLHVYADDTAASAPPIVQQGVICTAHTTLSRYLFRQALGAFLHDDGSGGQDLLGQARFALEATEAPRGYQAAVSLQERRIHDIERFQGHVPVEYLKEKYIEEMSHRDVVWVKLCEILDRLMRSIVDSDRDMIQAFEWADHMVDELAANLPVHGEFVRHNRGETREYLDDRDRSPTEPSPRYWFEKASEWMGRIQHRVQFLDQRERRSLARDDHTAAVVAGACFGFERRIQGTREELEELMGAYLHSRLRISNREQVKD